MTHAALQPVIGACAAVRTVAENLSRDGAAPGSALRVMNSWMASAGHRANLLDGRLIHLGVACVRDGGAVVYS